MADLIVNLVFAADARQADEGRSFFSKKGGGTRIGEQIVGEKVRLYSDPAYSARAGAPFDGAGPAAEEDRLGRQGRAEEPVVLALLGAEAGQGSDAAARAT